MTQVGKRIVDFDKFVARADHHQVMLAQPMSSGMKVLATGVDDSLEVVYYPKTLTLCHQPHPEWDETVTYYREFFLTSVRMLLTKKWEC